MLWFVDCLLDLMTGYHMTRVLDAWVQHPDGGTVQYCGFNATTILLTRTIRLRGTRSFGSIPAGARVQLCKRLDYYTQLVSDSSQFGTYASIEFGMAIAK